MINDLFNEFIALSDGLRRDYSTSLSKRNDDWKEKLYKINPDIPELFKTIYSTVSGTKRNIQQQELMDFVPGYRLIHIDELETNMNTLDMFLNSFDTLEYELILPLLGNYSSDYICYLRTKTKDEYIGLIMHDSNDIEVMHKSIIDFLTTICAFYKNSVYFLDENGYLDYDIEKECSIGSSINKNIEYWMT